MKKISMITTCLFIIGVSASLLIFNACQKKDKTVTEVGEKVELEVPGIMSYYNFLNQKTNGVIAVKNFTTKAMQYDNRNVEVMGQFYNKDMRAISGKTVYFDNITLTSNPSRNYLYSNIINSKKSPFSGRRVKISFENNFGTRIDENGFYIPEDIYLDPENGGGGSGGGTTPTEQDVLNVGKSFEWNADVNNTNGVVIILEYDPGNLANLSFTTSYPSRIRNAITVTDNGMYNITSTDLAGLPFGARITVTAGRANFETFTDVNNQQSYSVFAYTIAEGFYLLQ